MRAGAGTTDLWRRLVAVAIVLVSVAVAGCSAGATSTADPDVVSAAVTVAKATRVDVHGVALTLPAGSMTSDGSVTLRVRQGVQSVPDVATAGLAAHTGAVSVTTTRTRLEGRATVAAAVPRGWPAGWTPVWVWQDGNGGWQWLPTRMTSHDGRRVATATTGHFSGGFLAAFDPSPAAKKVLAGVTSFASGRSGRPDPTCQDESAARQRLTVDSDSGDAVKWCLGMSGGEPVLRVTNNLRTWAQVSTPTGTAVVNGGAWGFSVDNVVRLLGEGLSRFSQAFPSDRSIMLLRPGRTVDLRVPSSGRGGVEVETSVIGLLLQILVGGLEMYRTVSEAARLTATTTADSLVNLLGTGAGTGKEWADAAEECLEKFTDTYTDQLGESVTALDEVGRALKFAGTCGADIGKASIEASGPLAWMSSAVIATVSAVVGAVYALVEQGVAAVRGAVDNIAYLAGSRDDPVYDIVTTPALATNLVHDWYVHGSTLTFSSDGSMATSVAHAPCASESLDWCDAVGTYTVSAAGEALRLTLTGEVLKDRETGEVMKSSDGAPIGTSWTLATYDDEHAITTRYNPDGTRWQGEYGNELGNPYLCAPGAADTKHLCGA